MERLQKIVNSGAGRENPIGWAKEAQGPLQNVLQVLTKIDSESAQAGSGLGAAKAEVSKLTSELREAVNVRIEELGTEAHKIADGMSEAASATNTFHNSMSSAMHQQSEMAFQVQNLQNQVRNYFGLDEIFRKIGQLARDALDTVKELDAAMTETAVVTNFDVSDMWDMLPTYTKNANQLGSTIADVYNAATLYYQQGLTTTQSMALANETLKMARIGGIEAAEATDMMTAALRGFNMEINEASAQKINDVYSKLAAITAADTKEIGTAMERTASISKSANMDFETTSAFLAQMIETTREAPENLGTAMKTIVARFQEMKVDPNTLVDAEGERLDFNRVDKALKSVGISLVDEQNQFRNLDDVFLEISSRWDGMTQAQQRYIATIAAGSRQQSRFIAMMQDYDRTMELVDAAYTAEGAGQAQFEKTLESMDSKLNRLKNAWDQFAMGFMNADFLKVGVDAGTKFLDIFEKIITGISQIGITDPFKGIIKSALTVTAVFGGLLAMVPLLMKGIGKFASFAMKGQVEGMTGWAGQAARVYGGKTEKQEQRAKERENLRQQGKTQAKMRDSYFRTGMMTNQKYEGRLSNTRFSGVGQYFSNLKAGSRAQKEIPGMIAGFQKELKKGISKTLTQEDYKSAFAKLGKSGQKAMVPAISKGMHQAIEEANISDEAKKKAHKAVSQRRKEYTKGNISAETFNSMAADDVKRVTGGAVQGQQVASKMLPNLANQFNAVGKGAMNAGAAIQMFGMNLMGTPLAPFGTALMVVGQCVQNIGMLMSTNIAAIKKWGASMVAAGAEALGAGISANVASKFFAGLGATIYKSLVPMLPYIAAAAAVAAAIGLIAYAATADSRALKRQGDAAAQASQDLDTCKQALEAVNNDLTELANNDGALDSLVKGTTEWNNQLAEANAHIIAMMGSYKTLNEMQGNEYKYVKTDEDGRMSITKAGQEAIKKEYENAVNIATANNAVQGALYNNLKDKNSKEYKDDSATIVRYNRAGFDKNDDEYKLAVARKANVDQMNAAREENAWKTAIHAATNDLDLPNQESVENILTSQKDAIQETNKLGVTLGKQKELETEYADLMGYERVKDDTYKDAQGNELTIEFDTVKEQLPELRTIADMQEGAADLSKAINSMDSRFSDSETSATFEDSKILSEIMSESVEANADDIRKLIDKGQIDKFIKEQEATGTTYNKTQARELEKLIGEEEGSIDSVAKFNDALNTYGDQIKEKGEKILEQQESDVTAVAGLLTRAGAAPDIIQKGKRFSYDELNKIAIIGEGMGDNLGESVTMEFAKVLPTLNKTARTEVEDALSSVDLSNRLQVIDTFQGLKNNKYIEEGARSIGESFVNSFEYAEQSALALQNTITSDDLAEAIKDIEEPFTSTNIQEAAKTSSSLKTYLDAAGMSAGAFANIMNRLNDSELDISDLTAGVVAFANAMDQVSNATGKAMNAVENFDAGSDFGSVNDFSKGARDAIDEMIENGEYGNEQLGNYFDHFIDNEGKTWDQTARELNSYGKAYEQYNKKLKAVTIDDGDHAGEWDTKKLEKGLDLTKGTAEAVEALREKYDLTEIAANEALTAIINNSKTAKLKLQEADSDQAYEEYKKTGRQLGKEYGLTYEEGGKVKNQEIASLSELIDISSILGKDKAGDFWKQVAEDYNVTGKKLEGFNNAIEEYNNSEKKQTDEEALIKSLSSYLGGENRQVLTTTSKSSDKDIATEVGEKFYGGEANLIEGIKDLDKSAEAFVLAAGGDQNRGYAALEEYIRKNNLEDTTFEYEGQQITGQELLDQGIGPAIDTLIEGEQWVTVGETIGSALVEYLTNQDQEAEKRESAKKDVERADKTNTYFEKQADKLLLTYDKKTKENWDKRGFKDNGGITTRGEEIIQGIASNKNVSRQDQNFLMGQYGREQSARFVNQSTGEVDVKAATQGIQDFAQSLVDAGRSQKEVAEQVNHAFGTNITEKDVSISGKKGEETVEVGLDSQNLEEQLLAIHPTIEAVLNVTGITGGVGTGARGINNQRYGTMARGSKRGYTIPGRPTLTGEEGEELVWEPKRNEAYMVGSNGPQFADISRDAVVWNAEQTKRIKKNSGTVGNFGTGARGIRRFGTMGGGAHGGGAGSGIGKGAGGGTISGTVTINAIANITQITPEIVSVPAKIVVSGTEGTPFGTPGANEGVIQETINVTGKINQTIPPEVPPEVPVKAKIDTGNGKGGGLLGAIKSLITGNNENTIKVKAVADKVTVSDKGQTVKVKAEASEVSVSEKGKTIDITAKATSITPPENNTIDVTAKATSITPPEDNTISVTGELKSVTNKSKKTVKGVKAVATVNKVKKGKNVAGEPVKVKGTAVVSKADTSGAEGDVQGLADTASSAQTMTVNANTTQAYNAVGALLAFIRNSHPSIHVSASPSSITVPVTPDFRGNWHKTLYIDKKAEGQNYQKYNSYASGHGLVGPKGKGGLTLTGEEGYEVIWLPKQNEAMIVGLQGPQMINLPADAVVWPYKQSKKILANNQGAPVGSKADGTIHAGSLKKGRKAKPGEKRGVTKTIGAESRFFALIGNIEGAQASIERWSKKIDEAADKMDRYSKSVLHLSELNDSIAIQSKLIGKTYTEAAVTINNALKAIRQIDKSRKLVKISYTESAKPNAKERKISAKEGQLVKRNAETGELEINESWIRKKAKQKVKVKGKKKKRKKNAYQVNQIIEQLRSEASSLVDTYNGNLNDAQDALNEAKQARIELVDSIKELYYTWANDLTEIQNLQNRMDLASSVTEIVTSAQSLLETQMKNSFGQLKGIFGNTIEQYADLMGQSIEASLGEIENQQELINLNKQNFKNNYDFQPLFDEITTQRQTLKEIEKSSGINSEEYSNQLAYVQSLEEEYAARAKAQEYITTTFNEYGSADVNFDTSKLEQDKKEGKITETVYNSIKEQYEAIIEDAKNLNSAISGLNGQVSSLLSQRTDAYSQMDSTAKTIAAGMEKGEEEQIDQLETINNTIKDTISKLIDSVKKELSRRREQDQNLETEADISKKMNRLAALRADTSGGNQLEIAQLEEDIRKSTKSYGETLEDQLLNKLQDANDEAYEQRERQISIMQTGFEYSKSIGEYILAAENLLLTMTDPNATSEAREKAINEAKKYFMLGTNGGEILTQWGEALAEGEWENANAQVANFAETIKKLNDAITIVTLQITKAEDKKPVVQQMQQNGTSAQDAYSILRSAGVGEESAKKLISDTYGEEAASKINTNANTVSVGKTVSQPTSINVPEIGDATLDPAEQYQNFIDQFNNKENAEKKTSLLRAGFKNYMEYGKKELKKTPKELVKQLADTDLLSWTDVLEEYKNYRGDEEKAGKTVKSWYPKSKPGSNFRKAFAAVFGKWKKFKSGGVADFTGPAWLDGTPSKPELVLNSQDTKNFMTLKDVLGKSMSSIGSASNVNENNNFNISINVDQIANDYDVDRMVARVKKEITKSASYRNVSQVRNFR